MSDAEKPSSRNVPQPIQRAVRQRCGFGCVVCGLPLYEYEHMLGWANVERHVAEEITLLCDQHHREKTSGLLPADVVVAANADPFNLRTGVSKPYSLHFAGSRCEVVIGGNSFAANFANGQGLMVPVCIDRTALVAFRCLDDHLLLSLNLFDETNRAVLEIFDNQLVQSISPWDIQLVGTNLVVRERQRKILIDIEFEPPTRIRINRGRFLFNGVELLVRPDRLEIANNGTTLSGTSAINVPIGILIGEQVGMSTMFWLAVSRYVHNAKTFDEWAREMLTEST